MSRCVCDVHTAVYRVLHVHLVSVIHSHFASPHLVKWSQNAPHGGRHEYIPKGGVCVCIANGQWILSAPSCYPKSAVSVMQTGSLCHLQLCLHVVAMTRMMWSMLSQYPLHPNHCRHVYTYPDLSYLPWIQRGLYWVLQPPPYLSYACGICPLSSFLASAAVRGTSIAKRSHEPNLVIGVLYGIACLVYTWLQAKCVAIMRAVPF